MSRSSTRQRLAAVVAMAATGAAVLVGTAAPAGAVAVNNVSAVGSPMSEVAIATCPAATTLVGTGGHITNGNGNVVMTDVIPDLAAGTVTVWGHEKGMYGGNWSVTAVAVCEPVAGVVQVSAASAFNGAATKTVALACPANTQVTGVGYELVNGNGEVFPQLVQPNAALNGGVMSATENGAFALPWQITGYLLCAPPAGFAPQRFVSVNGPNGVSPKVAVTGNCPAGTVLFGTGADVSFTNGNVVLDMMTLDAAQTHTTSRGDEFGAFAGNWSITAYVICW